MIGPVVKVPMLPVVAKRFVDDAVVANELVVVAFVEVELPVMVRPPLIVEEAFETNPRLNSHERLSVAVVDAA